MVSFMHEQIVICRQTQLDDIVNDCRSRGGLSANEKEEKFASNDNYVIYSFSDQSFYKGSRIQPAQLSMFRLLWQWSLMLTFLYIARVKQLGI